MERPLYITLAEQTMREIKALFEGQPNFGPVLFVHVYSTEGQPTSVPTLKLASLNGIPQERWPDFIRKLVEESAAYEWAVATEVAMRFRTQAEDELVRTEEWLVYLLSHQGGMLMWGAPIIADRRLGEIRDLTDDPRLQKMLAHLSDANRHLEN